MLKRNLLFGICFLAAAASLPAQLTQGATNSYGTGVMSSYTVGAVTVGGLDCTVSVYAMYALDPANDSYVPQAQLTADVAGFISGYPNAKATPEAVLASAANSLLKKYPQVLSGEVGCTASVLDLKTYKTSISIIYASSTAPSTPPAATAEFRSFVDRSIRSQSR